jgi:hypothetical protein
MPKVEEDFKRIRLKRTEIQNLKTNSPARNREAEDSITELTNGKSWSNTTKNGTQQRRDRVHR